MDGTVPKSARNASRWGFLFLVTATGCLGVEHKAFAPVVPNPPRGVVFVADGAGGFEACSNALKESIEAGGLPLAVETVEWSHGFGRIVADQVGRQHVRSAGCSLAGRVVAIRSACPDTAVYFIGHSAGTAVVLDAAERLPAASVDRMVLLSPSVSADYDLRPALRCVRDGIDVYTSGRDWWYLGFGVSLTGTADGRWITAAAGRVGFRPRIDQPEDAALFMKLHQHPWAPCVAWTGNWGGHYGSHHPAFLRAYVLPLFSSRLPCPHMPPHQ